MELEIVRRSAFSTHYCLAPRYLHSYDTLKLSTAPPHPLRSFPIPTVRFDTAPIALSADAYKMLARATFRAASAPTLVARRGFQSTRAQLSSPYHYPEGPRSNLPFDPLKRGFAFKYWGFMGELR
jgi:cytochrome c oxidase subunit 7c